MTLDSQPSYRIRVSLALVCASFAIALCCASCSSKKEKSGLSQKNAALIMIGSLQFDASVVTRIGSKKFTPDDFDKNLDKYFEVAGFDEKLSAGFRNLFAPLSEDEGVRSMQSKAMINVLEEESLNKDDMGPAWLRLGMGMEFLAFSASVYDSGDSSMKNLPDTEAKKVLDNPLIKQMFEAGHLVELPQKMKTAFDSIENGNLKSQEGREKCFGSAKKFKLMARAVALQGLEALNIFSEESETGNESSNPAIGAVRKEVEAPANIAAPVNVAGGPSSQELQSVDDLLNQNNHASAAEQASQLRKKYPASSEAHYKSLKVIVHEIKWAKSLKGSERAGVMNKILAQDYPGLLCGISDGYMQRFGNADKHYVAVKALHDLARKALEGKPCDHHPMSSYNADQFVSLLHTNANLMKDIDSLNFE